jgi:hypothetical protein
MNTAVAAAMQAPAVAPVTADTLWSVALVLRDNHYYTEFYHLVTTTCRVLNTHYRQYCQVNHQSLLAQTQQVVRWIPRPPTLSYLLKYYTLLNRRDHAAIFQPSKTPVIRDCWSQALPYTKLLEALKPQDDALLVSRDQELSALQDYFKTASDNTKLVLVALIDCYTTDALHPPIGYSKCTNLSSNLVDHHRTITYLHSDDRFRVGKYVPILQPYLNPNGLLFNYLSQQFPTQFKLETMLGTMGGTFANWLRAYWRADPRRLDSLLQRLEVSPSEFDELFYFIDEPYIISRVWHCHPGCGQLQCFNPDWSLERQLEHYCGVISKRVITLANHKYLHSYGNWLTDSPRLDQALAWLVQRRKGYPVFILIAERCRETSRLDWLFSKIVRLPESPLQRRWQRYLYWNS